MLHRCSSSAVMSSVPEYALFELEWMYDHCLVYGRAQIWAYNAEMFSYLLRRNFIEVLFEECDEDGPVFSVRLTHDAVRFLNKHSRQYRIVVGDDDLPF